MLTKHHLPKKINNWNQSQCINWGCNCSLSWNQDLSVRGNCFEALLRLWRSWLAFPAQRSASSCWRPCCRSFPVLCPRRPAALSSAGARSPILPAAPSPLASSCCSSLQWELSSSCPRLHLRLGHFHSCCRARPPAARRSAPYLDFQSSAWLQPSKQSKTSVTSL